MKAPRLAAVSAACTRNQTERSWVACCAELSSLGGGFPHGFLIRVLVQCVSTSSVNGLPVPVSVFTRMLSVGKPFRFSLSSDSHCLLVLFSPLPISGDAAREPEQWPHFGAAPDPRLEESTTEISRERHTAIVWHFQFACAALLSLSFALKMNRGH